MRKYRPSRGRGGSIISELVSIMCELVIVTFIIFAVVVGIMIVMLWLEGAG